MSPVGGLLGNEDSGLIRGGEGAPPFRQPPPAFKFYEVEGGRVVSSSVEKNAARGHDAVIAYLESKGIDMLISGEVCECGRQRMFDQDIEIYSGVDGQADGRVTDCLAGRLVSDRQRRAQSDINICFGRR